MTRLIRIMMTSERRAEGTGERENTNNVTRINMARAALRLLERPQREAAVRTHTANPIPRTCAQRTENNELPSRESQVQLRRGATGVGWRGGNADSVRACGQSLHCPSPRVRTD